MSEPTQTPPRITLITPSFNQARYLERAIVSVLDQGYEQLEYIVVDGGSADDSIDIIRRYEHELAWWVSAPHDSPAAAINRGLRYATGDLVAFLDADDLLMPFALQHVAERYLAGDAPLWIVGRTEHIDACDRVAKRDAHEPPTDLSRYLRSRHLALGGPATFYARQLVDSVGQLDADLAHWARFDLNCRLFSLGASPTRIAPTLAQHRLHAASMSRRDRLGRKLERDRVVWRYVHTQRAAATARRPLRDAA